MQIKPLIYVCSPLSGDIEGNLNKAKRYSRFVYTKGCIPIAPHIYFTQFLDDTIREERAAGMTMGIEVLSICDELWTFGERISEGMDAEILKAKDMGIKVIRFNERCEPLEVKEDELQG